MGNSILHHAAKSNSINIAKLLKHIYNEFEKEEDQDDPNLEV
jgi:hypothetical protein